MCEHCKADEQQERKSQNDDNIFTCKLRTRVRPRFFDQVGYQTTNASNKALSYSINNVIVRLTKIVNRAVKNWAHF